VLTSILDGSVYRLSWIEAHTALMLPMNECFFFNNYKYVYYSFIAVG